MTLTWTASELLTGKKFQRKGLIVAFKNGKQSFSSTTDDQDDADLKITLPEPSATYLVEVNYGVSGDPAADIVLAWDVTGGATVVRTTETMETGALGGVFAASNTKLIFREQSTGGWSAGTNVAGEIPSAVREKMIVTTSTQPSTLNLVWHQNTSSTVWTTVHDYGWAVARRLT